MMTMRITEKLAEVLLLPVNQEEMEQLVTDLLTPQEIERVWTRWQNGKLSAEGLAREEVKDRTGSSLATISRARVVVEHGTGILKTLFQRLEESRENS